MKRQATVLGLVLLLTALVPAARAGSVLFSNFGPGNSYDTGDGNFVGNGLDGTGNNYASGDTFTPSATGPFTSLTIALSNYYGTNTDTLAVSLTADSGANSPGSVLAAFDIGPGSLGLFGLNNAPLVLTAIPGISLMAGTQYWVTVADISGGTDTNVWNWNTTGDASANAISTDGGMTWFSPSGLTPGAYSVNGASVPEPSTLVLLSTGALGVVLGRRRMRRRTARPVASRPETEELEARLVLSTSITWTEAPQPYLGANTMILYPDGSIMEQATSDFSLWQVLEPSATGSYSNYFQIPLAYQMSLSRLYFASNVLPNGNIFVLGGEYSGPNLDQNETNTGEMFVGPDNFTGASGFYNTVPNFPAQYFGDDSSMLLNNGLILLATGSAQGYPYDTSGETYLYNPTSSAITAMVNGSPASIAPGTYSAPIPPVNFYGVAWSSSEQGWVKLPNGNVLTYDVFLNDLANYDFGTDFGGFAEQFDPSTGMWQDVSPATGAANGVIPPLSSLVDINNNLWAEEGGVMLLPNGNVFIISGGTSNTALYNPGTNTWSAGPQIPFPYTADDAPAAVLPNGDVIFTADAALQNGQYNGPTAFFDYTPPANGVGPGTITQLTGSNVPDDPALAYGSYVGRFLVLPNGQLMYSNLASGETFVGTPSGGPQPQWRPVVNKITGSGSNYVLTGLRLNGMDAGAVYGDDAETDENYPIVRLTNAAGNVYYALTSNWSNLGVATGNATETVNFALPGGMAAGNYSLVVSGAGISSFPVAFHLASSTPVSLAGTGIHSNVVPLNIKPGAPPVTSVPIRPHVDGSLALLLGSGTNASAVDSVLALGDLSWVNALNPKPKSK